ncbi:MAG: helix-turn-helix domain-containing protein [Gammaproteobacteria bacterium]
MDHIKRHRWVAGLSLSGTWKGVLRVLADYGHSQTLKCWPSIETIVRESGFCKDTVLRAIRGLSLKGVIDVDHSNGRKRNVYVLRIANSPSHVPLNGTADRPLEKYNGTGDRPQQSGRQTVNGTSPVPEPVKNQGSNQGSLARSAFDVFYHHYPRHVAKSKAQEVWNSKKLDPKLQPILADLQKRKSNGCWIEAKYIPHPATYLNQERWQDEDDPAPRLVVRHVGVVL